MAKQTHVLFEQWKAHSKMVEFNVEFGVSTYIKAIENWIIDNHRIFFNSVEMNDLIIWSENVFACNLLLTRYIILFIVWNWLLLYRHLFIYLYYCLFQKFCMHSSAAIYMQKWINK